MRRRRSRAMWRTVLNPQLGPPASPPADPRSRTGASAPTHSPAAPDPKEAARRRTTRRNAVLFATAAAAAGIVLAGLSRADRALVPAPRAAVAQPTPVGLIASPLVMAVDRRGDMLPVDPGDPVLDLPVLRVMTPRADAFWGTRVLARDVARMAEAAPEVFAVISEARLGDRDVTLLLGDSEVRVRYQPPITEMRLRQAIFALNDAVARLDATPREIDIRFADQVVVRTR